MSLVAPTLAEWLRSPELVEVVQNASIAAAWGDLAPSVAQSSPLALRADAAVEAGRQLGFFGGPLAVETLEMTGKHSGLVGTAPRIAADQAGYEDAPSVFVIGAEERAGGTTLLTVLRRMEGG